MKLNKLIVAAGAVLATAVATPGFAQMKEFVGASVYGSTGYNTWSTEWSGLSYSGTSVTADTSTSAGFPLYVGIDHTWALSDTNSLGLSIERNFIKSSTGNTCFYAGGASQGCGTVTVDDSYQVSILPGVLIDKNSLVYGKLGYYSAGITVAGTSQSWTYTQTGYSLGAGVKKLFHLDSAGNNFYIFGESNYRFGNSAGQSLGSVTGDLKLGGMNVLVGLGMHF